MTLELFLTCLTLTVGIVLLAMSYLRGIARRVIIEQCQSGTGAEFWLRSADVLALSGSLMLVLTFGVDTEQHNWLASVRLSTLCALGGVFLAVLFMASSVWRNLPRPQAPSTAANPAEA